MDAIVRMYEIAPANTQIQRGWQGHKKEKKWFYCNTGSFNFNIIKLDSFEMSLDQFVPSRFLLDSCNPQILEVEEGYATAFKALEENSKILVFSNVSLEESKNDDFRYPMDKWKANW